MSRRHAATGALCALVLAACGDRSHPSAAVDPASRPPPAARTTAPATPRDPGRPEPVSDAVVHAELEAARLAAARTSHHGASEAAAFIRLFDRARTTRALNHLAFGALAALDHAPGRESRALRAHLVRAYARHGRGLQPAFTLGNAAGGECMVNFDDPDKLGDFIDDEDPQALYTNAPHWVQECGDGDVYVLPVLYDHTHMLFEDSTIDCMDLETGLFGRGEVLDCTPLADALQEDRYVGTHNAHESLRIRRRAGGTNIPFDVHSFVVTGSQPVRFRFRTGNGPWFQWSSLDPNWVYDVSQWVVGATEVLVSNANTSQSCGPDWEAAEPGPCPVGASAIMLDDILISP